MTTQSNEAVAKKEEHVVNASSTAYKNGFPVPAHRLDPIARILLMAVYDDAHTFSALRGMRFIVKHIWELAVDPDSKQWSAYIEGCKQDWNHKGFADLQNEVAFPEPADLSINMMPFIMHSDFAKTKLPQYLKPYFDRIIRRCYYSDKNQKDKIYFLTIHESFVEKGKTQRRPGLHVECPGRVCICDELTEEEKHEILSDIGGGQWSWDQFQHHPYHFVHSWGVGMHGSYRVDGIFMCSSVDESCQAWNCRIIADKDGREVIGHLGDVEHLRKYLPHRKVERHSYNQSKYVMKRNRLYWLTDRTPHESLPMKQAGYRQFFRLVSDKVSLWYEQHSTPNPNGVLPDPEITRIIKGNKFKSSKQTPKITSLSDDDDAEAL